MLEDLRERALRGAWQLTMRFAMSPLFPATIGRPQILRALGITLPKSSSIATGTVVGGCYHVFGEHVLVNTDCHLDGAAPIRLEDRVRIGARVVIITGGHDIQPRTMRLDPAKPTHRLPVTIRYGTWVGAGSTILPGVTIAEGCVIAAGAVVTRDTEPNGLYAGSPARRVRDLPVSDDGARTSETVGAAPDLHDEA